MYSHLINYRFLEVAKSECESAGDRCVGVSTDESGYYHLRSKITFKFEEGSTSWIKGQIWDWDALNVENFCKKSLKL